MTNAPPDHRPVAGAEGPPFSGQAMGTCARGRRSRNRRKPAAIVKDIA